MGIILRFRSRSGRLRLYGDATTLEIKINCLFRLGKMVLITYRYGLCSGDRAAILCSKFS